MEKRQQKSQLTVEEIKTNFPCWREELLQQIIHLHDKDDCQEADLKCLIEELEKSDPDEMTRYFCREVILKSKGMDLAETRSRLLEQISLLWKLEGWPVKSKREDTGRISPSEIQRAKTAPFEVHLAEMHWRPAGTEKCKALCCFHDERTPSLCGYQDGHFYCFGCHRKGDVIELCMFVHQLNFPAAVSHCLGDAA